MKIALLGYGKMGKAIEQYCLDHTEHTIVLTIDENQTELLTKEELSKADVAIDFSSPDAAFKHITTCIESQLPVVSGTTGWLEKWNEVENLVQTQNGSFFYSSNFSIGVNLFWQIIEYASAMINEFPEYSTLLEETHHIHKLDAPSGTAITTAEKMIAKLHQYKKWELDETKDQDSLLIKSYREGEVPGTHLVTFANDIDQISIEHKAKSRQGFVIGAVKAAEFIHDKKGLFGMDDLLK